MCLERMQGPGYSGVHRISLFEPFDLSRLTLKNRIVMAPMTHARRPNLIPDTLTAEYYRKRRRVDRQ